MTRKKLAYCRQNVRFADSVSLKLIIKLDTEPKCCQSNYFCEIKINSNVSAAQIAAAGKNGSPS